MIWFSLCGPTSTISWLESTTCQNFHNFRYVQKETGKHEIKIKVSKKLSWCFLKNNTSSHNIFYICSVIRQGGSRTGPSWVKGSREAETRDFPLALILDCLGLSCSTFHLPTPSAYWTRLGSTINALHYLKKKKILKGI